MIFPVIWESFDGMTDILHVELGERRYPIHIGADLWDLYGQVLGELREGKRPFAVVTDENLHACKTEYLVRIHGKDATLVLPAGEKTKSLSYLGEVYEHLARSKVDRSGALIAIGGGVIGDLAGFAAASYLRGVDFYQVPTTLLAMVDSSVGGKTGINIEAGKNLVGAFHQPKAVFIDTSFLDTLPPREFNAGMAEIIKYGMLADRALFQKLLDLPRIDGRHPELPFIIRTCCSIKADVVRSDERETAKSGGRALLNLGHTFGHAVENAAGYGEYLHGEAVALGLVMATRLSQRLGHLDDSALNAVRNLVGRYDLPTKLWSPLPVDALLGAMKHDKKVRHGRMRFVAMEQLGRAVTVDGVPEEWVVELWREFGAV